MISKIGKRVGRRRISHEVRDLIFQMVAENPTWGAPRIHGELLMLGFDVSERSVSRWMKRAPKDPKLCRPRMGGVDKDLLGIRPPFVGCLEAVSRARQSRDGRSLASGWVSNILELDLQGQEAGG